MPLQTYRSRNLRAFPALLAALACSLLSAPVPALAGAGSGSALVLGMDPVLADTVGFWNISYRAAEDFDTTTGGVIEVQIPAGWSAPQDSSSGIPGYFALTDVEKVDSLSISGNTIRLYLGGGPHVDDSTKFLSGGQMSILYGVGGGAALGRAQTNAPATAVFLVRSDPQLTGTLLPIAASPSVSVVPDTVVSVDIVDSAGAPVDTLTRTTDQDTTQLFLRGYDAYGNPVRFIRCDWTVAGGIGAAAPANGTSTVLQLSTSGTGHVTADSAGVWADSTGAITVLHGAYAGLAMTAAGSATAGAGFAVTAAARDADGNTVTDGSGSAAALTAIAYADSAGTLPSDPGFVSASVALTGGAYAGSLVARRAGVYWLAVTDSATGFKSALHRVDVAPGGPDHVALAPDTLRLTAGVPDTATVLVYDAYGNRAPVLAPETLTLWTDRPAGAFSNVAGTAAIFEVTVPAGGDSVRFRFTDTQTTSAEGRVRAIDANGQSPFLGTAGVPVFTAPGVPATIALGAAPDTLLANNADQAVVSGTARDAYGNAVAQGERFTLDGGSLLTAITDQDPGAPGAQLLADSAGAVSGAVRAGSVAGAGVATVTAERAGTGAPASATVAVRLLADAPSGAIALSAPADSLAADSVATLAVSASGLHDSSLNQVLNGEKYTVSTTLGAIQGADADPSTPGHQVSASGGTIAFTLFGGDVLGNATVTAKAVRDTSSAGTLDVRLVPGDVSASRSGVSAGTPAPVGATGSIVTVTLRDSQDHALAVVPAASVAVGVTGLTATVTALGSATDAAGRIGFRATASVADTGVVHVTARGVPLASQPTIIYQPGPLDHYTIAGPAGPLTAGTGVTLSISAFDGFGNPVSGESGEVLRPAVTSGGATVPDSVTLVNGGTTVAVTPTQASPLTIVVSEGPRSVTYGPVAVNPSGAATLSLAPSSLSLTPTQLATVTLTVRDPQGNPIPGYAVTFFLGGPNASGTLESNGGTSGGPGSQSGVTNSSGVLTVRYRAPALAPAADSVFAAGGSLAPVGIRATTSPGPTTALRVLPATLAWTAGVPESVRVQAIDAFGNFVASDGATVTIRPVGSVVWSPASGPLVGGQLVTTGRDTIAETFAIGADRAGGGSGVGGTATVGPAAPSGLIAMTATRDSLTADGHSSSAVTLGPVRDAFGNLVSAGTLIGVSAQTGTLLASDADSSNAGLDLATGATGKASVVLIAPLLAGRDTLSAATRLGTAAGTHAFTYVPPPSLAYVAGSLAPVSVTPGGSAAFSLQVRNTGSGPIQLGAGSTFSFGSGGTTFAATVASGVSIGAGATSALSFAAATVPAGLAPGSYAPSFRAVGTDGTGANFDFYLNLGGVQVSVLGVGVVAVSASPNPVPLGYQTLALVFDVSNNSGTPGDFSGASVSYSSGSFITRPPTPALGTTIPAGATTRFSFPVQVPSSGIPPGTTIDATLQATLSYGGSPVSASNAIPLAFRVISAAQVAAVPGSSAPQRFLRGRTSSPTVRVANTGAAAVTLSRGTTRLVLDLGATTLSTPLSANTAVQASDQATLVFDSLAVPGATPKGRYRARLLLDGIEAGQAFADTVPFAPDSVDVVDPALLSVLAGSLSPDTVSAGQARPLALTLRNDGDVPFILDASTTLALGLPLSVTRTLGASPTLNAGQSLVLTFPGGALGAAASPGNASATLDVFGLEEGVPRAQSLGAGILHAMPPAALQFVARSTAPDQMRPGQTVDLTLDVRNGGGSPFALDPATTGLNVTDGADVISGFASGAPVMLAPGGQSTLSFPGLTVPSSMASQPYRVALTVQGTEWGLAGSVSISSPDSEIVVLDQLAAIQVRGIDTVTPVQVAPGGAAIPVWGLELTPLTAVGTSTRDSLRSVALTVLTDGSATTSPAASVASLALRDRAGALLAQITPTGSTANPVTLVLTTPLIMTGGPESLFVEVAFRPGTTALRAQLALAQASDVVAFDAFTGGLVSIVGGGGLPFVALRSREVTFFARPHGYPNPFHAGSEAILLSYVLGQDAAVKVSIYTLLGGLVREMSLSAGGPGGAVGLNEVPWDGRNGKGEMVRPGVYVARINGPGVSEQIKVGVLR